jgi:hypothetical protein
MMYAKMEGKEKNNSGKQKMPQKKANGKAGRMIEYGKRKKCK